jgi:hypothetical protein
LVAILLLAAAFFFPFLGAYTLFDWDEINFAESSREMLLTGNLFSVTVNFEPFMEKPPLFFWLQSLSYSAFGVNEFAARFPNAVFGILTLWLLYSTGRRIRDTRFALIWPLVYLASLLPHLYFRSGIIDPVFNFFIFLSVIYLIRGVTEKKNGFFLASGLFSGLSVLTKGPVGLLLLVLTWFAAFALKRKQVLPSGKAFCFFALAFAVSTFAWYGPETLRNGPVFLLEFIKYQIDLFLNPVAGHKQFLLYHFLVVFLGCFPLSIFGLGELLRTHYPEKDGFRFWMVVLFWVVMILFTIVTTKIVHYSSMAYLPLSFLAASFLSRSTDGLSVLVRGLRIAFLAVGTILTGAIVLLPIAGVFREHLLPFIADEFTRASFSREVNWSGWEACSGAFFAIGIVMGYRMLRRGKVIPALFSMAVGTGITLSFYAFLVIPRIEDHSQGPLIDFCWELKGKDLYFVPVGFKTYAIYFYAEVDQNGVKTKRDPSALLQEAQEIPVYAVAKVSNKNVLKDYPLLEEIKTDGGYRFFRQKKINR